MKLSKREKNMLLFLIGIVIVFGYYKFIYTPQHEKIVKLQMQVEEMEKNKLNFEKILSPKNKIYKEYKILNSKILLAERNFYSDEAQEDIIVELDSIIKKSNLKVVSISFTEPKKEEIGSNEKKKEEKSLLEQYSNMYQEIGNKITEKKIDKENKDDKTDKVKKITANIVFERNSFSELMDFLTQLEFKTKRTVVKNISINMESNLLRGIITLDYYLIPYVVSKEESILRMSGDYGVDNPFKYFKGYNVRGKTDDFQTFVSNGSKVARENFDFYMGLRPITADLPTVVIGRSNDNSGNSYIYGDNAGIEKVEFRFMKHNGKYYYKYKTQLQSMPKNYKDDMIPFIPIGKNIVLRIVSSLRKEENDNSGVYLSLINDTDLKLEVNISNDDPEKPRINIATKKGNIVIHR
ncbi:hypothetical protein [Caminicella sporogenes]|uniref:hypothetical protein n=1 Tax=Caminicella sporogenes TaxID=166485 RepID=UPI000934496C|nr:hypothetical protein [Caminicella sporogenes]RKD27895.1 hypothetical protein BET04_02205 [Caminicella sporogenes]